MLRSIDQEFSSDKQDLERLSKEVQEEISLAKALIDRQDQKLQELERTAASKSRSILRSFVPKIEDKLGTITTLQKEHSAIRASRYFSTNQKEPS